MNIMDHNLNSIKRIEKDVEESYLEVIASLLQEQNEDRKLAGLVRLDAELLGITNACTDARRTLQPTIMAIINPKETESDEND